MTTPLHFEKEVAISLCSQQEVIITSLREGSPSALRQVKGHPVDRQEEVIIFTYSEKAAISLEFHEEVGIPLHF